MEIRFCEVTSQLALLSTKIENLTKDTQLVLAHCGIDVLLCASAPGHMFRALYELPENVIISRAGAEVGLFTLELFNWTR